MKKKITILLFILILFTISSCNNENKENHITLLHDGFYYHHLNISQPKYRVKTDFNLFYIAVDPLKYNIELLLAKDYKHNFFHTRDYLKLSKALFVINASFFDENFKPLGLQIKKGKVIKKLKRIDGGVFFIKDNQAKITHTKEFRHNNKIQLAIQSRPRLVHDGKPIPLLKKQIAKRSFICINNNQQVILGVTEDSKAYADDLANILAIKKEKGGLGCLYALNLDGGSSSQVSLNYNHYVKEVTGGIGVPNALAIFSKNK